MFDDIAPALPGPRRRALEVVLLLAEPGDAIPDPLAIGLAVLDALRALSSSGPCVLALDDIQWLDAASAGALQIALRRLAAEPVAVLATLRHTPRLAIPIDLDRSFDADRLTKVVVGPLDLAAFDRLLRERVGLDLTRPELVRLQSMTHGNPFFALEVGREMARSGTRPTEDRVVQVPETLSAALAERLARLPAETAEVLLKTAALARPTVEVVVAAHGDREAVLRSFAAAAADGLVTLDDERVYFTHPLHSSVCYQQAPISKRRAVHRSLALAVVDPEERALHLAREPRVRTRRSRHSSTQPPKGPLGVERQQSARACSSSPRTSHPTISGLCVAGGCEPRSYTASQAATHAPSRSSRRSGMQLSRARNGRMCSLSS